MIERYRRKDADPAAAADRKDPASNRIELERVAERLQIVPRPDALRRNVDGQSGAGAQQQKGLRPGQGGAAARGDGRIAGGVIDAQREGESRRREEFEAVEGAEIACRREQALALQRRLDEELMRRCRSDGRRRRPLCLLGCNLYRRGGLGL